MWKQWQFESSVPSLVPKDSDLRGQYFGPEDLVLDALEAVALVGLVRRVHATPHPLEESQLKEMVENMDGAAFLRFLLYALLAPDKGLNGSKG